MPTWKNLTRMGIVLCIIYAVSSCNTSQDSSPDLITIDVEKAYDEPKRDMMLSEIVEDVEYIKLETSPDCFIQRVSEIEVSENYLVVFDYRQQSIFLFKRSGEFLYKIGSQGKGPGEYPHLDPNSLQIISNEQYLLFNDFLNTIYIYNIDGSFRKKVSVPARTISHLEYVVGNKIMSFHQRPELPEKGGHQILSYDTDLNIIDRAFFQSQDTLRGNGKSPADDVLSVSQNKTYMIKALSDTIFELTEDYKTIPKVKLDFGSLKRNKLHLSWEDQYKFLTVSDIEFTTQLVLITLFGKSRIPDSSTEYMRPQYLIHNLKTGEEFFLDNNYNYAPEDRITATPKNDIDGVEDVLMLTSINKGKTWYPLTIIDSKEFIESDSFDPSKLSTQKYYNRIKKLLDESDIEDNPIIRICYLK